MISKEKERIKVLAKKYNISYEQAYKIAKAYLDKGIKWKV